MREKDILLIIPAYNEEKNLPKTLEGLFRANINEEMDIMVLNDGSSDATERVAREAGVQVMSLLYNFGYGASLQTGYKYTFNKGYKYVLQMDADGQHDVRNLERICERLISEAGSERVPDIVIGTRFLEGSETFYISKLKMFAIKLFRFVIRITTGYIITDPTSGLMGLNRRAFSYYAKYTNFDTKYPDLNMIVQMLLLGYHIEEIPAIMHERLQGSSMHDGLLKVGRYMIIMALSTLNAYMRHRKVKHAKDGV